MELERDFLPHSQLVRKLEKKKCILNFCNFFFPLKENICDNALDLANAQLIFEGGPSGTYCHWLISAKDGYDYVTLEFEILNVKNSLKRIT